MKYGTALRRFTSHGGRSEWSELDADHPAVIEGRTKFHTRVIHASVADRLLKSGHHNRKIGKAVMKGAWAGMPIYTLTLEERATCPRSCLHWLDCFGNKMGWAPRLIPGTALENKLMLEVRDLADRHPEGFVVRLHVLGDFYSVRYAAVWASMVELCPQLHVYGYTAHGPDTEIGRLIAHARFTFGRRFAIRHSNADVPEWGTRTLYDKPASPRVAEGIVCPAQTGRTECCATCALCWQTSANIAFLAH